MSLGLAVNCHATLRHDDLHRRRGELDIESCTDRPDGDASRLHDEGSLRILGDSEVRLAPHQSDPPHAGREIDAELRTAVKLHERAILEGALLARGGQGRREPRRCELSGGNLAGRFGDPQQDGRRRRSSRNPGEHPPPRRRTLGSGRAWGEQIGIGRRGQGRGQTGDAIELPPRPTPLAQDLTVAGIGGEPV